MRDLPDACVETVFLLACLQEWDNPGLRGKTLCAVDERTRCHPAVHEVREDATHRFAFELLNECFTASQGASSLGIRPGSLPREAICRSLKGKSSIGFDVEK